VSGRGGAALLAMALAVVVSGPAAAQPGGKPPSPGQRPAAVAPGVTFERLDPLLGESDLYLPPTPDDRLEPQDEVTLARACSSVQRRLFEEGLAELRRLSARYPRSRRVIATTASALTASGRPQEALELVDRAARLRAGGAAGDGAGLSGPQPPGARSQPSAADAAEGGGEVVFARERAEAYLALGKRHEAIPWMAAACAGPGVRSARMRAQLLSWSETLDLGPRVLAEVGEQADAAPANVELALLAAEMECRTGHAERAWPRLAGAEERGGVERRGQLLRVLAERLSIDAARARELGTPAWLELARGAAYDPELRGAALGRLLGPAPAERGPEGAAIVAGATVATADLEAAWRSLPAGAVRSRSGLDLADFLRRRGDEAAARRVIVALDREGTPPDLQGELDLQQGLAAVQGGDLDAARRLLERARGQAVDPAAGERAAYALAEARFYAGEFDSALTAFDDFARAHPQSPLANDALERAYLLEADGGGGPAGAAPGVATLARGLYAEARGRWDEAASLAREAEAQARAAQPADPRSGPGADSLGGPSDPVRAHALLLLSRAEERRGDFPAALGAALLAADSLWGDRLAPAARERAGDLLLAHGRPAEALAQYEEMLARHPRAWLAAEVRRKVTELRQSGRRDP
jgi:tetratricopeptide (TPR) repeat protein